MRRTGGTLVAITLLGAFVLTAPSAAPSFAAASFAATSFVAQADTVSVTSSAIHPPTDALGSADLAGDAPTASPTRLEAVLANRIRRTAPATRVTVEVVGDDAAVRAAVEASGGKLGRGGAGEYLAQVPAGALTHLAEARGVAQVRTPVRAAEQHVSLPRPLRGPTSNNASDIAQAWHQLGHTGVGSKVGIIGLFDIYTLGLQRELGELPPVPASHGICITSGEPCPFGTPNQTWGNSLAEIVADAAPDADFYLAELGVRSDYYLVIDWMAEQGVQILVNPIVWTYDGPGNGTGPSAAIIDYAVSKGIAWFNTAGEGARVGAPYGSFDGTYLRTTWRDTNNNKWMDFNPPTTRTVDESLTIYCGLLLGLRWSDWGATRTDFDLYAADYYSSTRKTSATKKLVSGTNQSLSGTQSLEANTGFRPCNTDPTRGPVIDVNNDGFISLFVKYEPTRSSGNSPVGDTIEIGTSYGWLEYSSNEGSAGIAFADSANPGMVTVGGLPGHFASALPATGYGPLNDGRQKPDLVADQCLATLSEGNTNDGCDTTGYFGSDAAAAMAAGVAALARPVAALTTPAQIALFTRNSGRPAIDQYGYGQRGPRTGYGAVGLHEPPPTNYPRSTYFPSSSPARLFDSRTASHSDLTTAPTRLEANETVHLQVGAMSAVVLNVVVVNMASPGYLAAYPSGWAAPGQVASLNTDAPGQTRSNLVVVPVGADGYIDIHVSAAADVVVDEVGFFQIVSPGTTQFGNLEPIAPRRIVDSRTCTGLTGCTGLALAANTWTTVSFTGVTDPADPSRSIPASATAVALSVTVDAPDGRGYLAAVPSNFAGEVTSALNYESGQSATTLSLVALSGGEAKFLTSRNAHLQIDVLGWFSGSHSIDDPYGQFVPTTPSRLVDTRDPVGSPQLPGGTPRTVDTTTGGVPLAAIAAFVNHATIRSAGPGEVQTAATAQPQPAEFRNLSLGAANQTRAGSTLTRLQAGAFTFRSSTTAHHVSDLVGYFQGITDPPLADGETERVTGFQFAYNAYQNGGVTMSDDARWFYRPSDGILFDRNSGTTTDLSSSYPYSGRVSGDGRTVLHEATKSGSYTTVKAYDPVTTTDEEVAVTSAEVSPPTGNSWVAGLSATGGRVLLASFAALAPGAPGPSNLGWFLRDRDAGTTTLVPAPSDALTVELTRDGNAVVWTSYVAPSQALPYGASVITRYRLSDGATTARQLDGLYPMFTIDGDGSLAVYRVVENGGYNLYRLDIDTGVTTPIGGAGVGIDGIAQPNAAGTTITLWSRSRLRTIDLDGNVLDVIDRAWNGRAPDSGSSPPVMSADGRTVAFASEATNLFATPSSGYFVYVHTRA
jgi:hypothetical protein